MCTVRVRVRVRVRVMVKVKVRIRVMEDAFPHTQACKTGLSGMRFNEGARDLRIILRVAFGVGLVLVLDRGSVRVTGTVMW